MKEFLITDFYSTNSHKIFINTVTSRYQIDVRDIIRIQSISNYSKLFFNDGKTMVVPKVLGRFAEELNGKDFVRVHRTHLVNTDYINTYYSANGRHQLELRNGELINVSRRKAAGLKQLKSLNQHILWING